MLSLFSCLATSINGEDPSSEFRTFGFALASNNKFMISKAWLESHEEAIAKRGLVGYNVPNRLGSAPDSSNKVLLYESKLLIMESCHSIHQDRGVHRNSSG
eukprot:CAMPEP_0117865750 /NCGR_PEP_ID=MMETSP0950-20121206/6926_1 /TAXON_ID=44440 /ORGANISM="Chattonella subsalsa, Strain CCMP2191" /LENGTH=100 /DNA_ID=CAMNT_0005716897 /DNA_START=416 /DNA_END=718 /DNA_ORIENTATION=+